jgi:hypothetical protein
VKIKICLGIIYFVTNTILLYSQEYVEIKELDTYNFIAGPSYGYSGEESSQWKVYKEISLKYSSRIIEQKYYETNSIVTKIYLYWILRDRNWDNIAYIYNDLLKYKDIKLGFARGCLIYMRILKDIINDHYWEH